ncbi:MAG: tripartite tricarboxylate transporter substrate binding protein [Betaproteobacteria bacterium]|nr:tripartite tricarboxylate transporter substrate binding protein [Betaproteobacteria bacterium]
MKKEEAMSANRKWVCGAVMLVSAVMAAEIFAQSYPSRPVRMVIPYPAGGGTDITARPIAHRLGEVLGQQFIVENRGGGNGMIGADVVAKSAPDGHTVLVSASSEMTMNVVLFKKMPYDPVRDFHPVTLATTTPALLMSHPSLPVKSVKELIALARSKPGALTYASVGAGTPQHFAGELMKHTLKIDWVHVPYKGAAPALVDLLGGHVPVGFVALLPSIPHVRAGKLRPLAVTSAQRSSALADVPTIAESGLPGFDIMQWFAVWVPAKTPRDIIDRLNGEIVKVVQSPEYKKRMTEAGADAVGSTAEHLGQLQRIEIEKYRKIAALAGITPE